MAIKSIHVTVPNNPPFDRADWFESVVGNFFKPIIATGLLQSYWFTRYQDPVKHARFRLNTADYAVLKPTVDDLIADLGFTDVADEENYADNEFTSVRWCGARNPPVDPAVRQGLTWDFLSAAAALYVDTFSHADAQGYWVREANQDKAQNIDGDTIESVHHLFCNMTAVCPRVEMLEQVDGSGFTHQWLIAGTYRRWNQIPDHVVRISNRVNFCSCRSRRELPLQPQS